MEKSSGGSSTPDYKNRASVKGILDALEILKESDSTKNQQ
jgi:hypothetical protein